MLAVNQANSVPSPEGRECVLSVLIHSPRDFGQISSWRKVRLSKMTNKNGLSKGPVSQKNYIYTLALSHTAHRHFIICLF